MRTQAPEAALPTCGDGGGLEHHATLRRRGHERFDEGRRQHVTVRRNEEGAVHVRQVRLEPAHLVRVEHAVHHARVGELARQGRQADRLGVGRRHLQSAAARVLDVGARLGAHPLDELVVEGEAPDAKLEEGGDVPLDVGGEHAGGRASGTLPGRPWVHHVNPRPATRELVCDGAADDACADDRHSHDGKLYCDSRGRPGGA